MSRSRYKHPRVAWVGGNNKQDRTIANRKMRKANRDILRKVYTSVSFDDLQFKKLREVSDTYDFTTDGLPRTTSIYKQMWMRGSIYESIQAHDWKSLKYYYGK